MTDNQSCCNVKLPPRKGENEEDVYTLKLNAGTPGKNV